MRWKAAGLTLILLGVLLVMRPSAPAGGVAAQNTSPERRVVTAVDYLGRATVPVGQYSGDTEIGGLSALTYDAAADHYYILSDDRSERDPARFYTATIDLSDGTLSNGDVVFGKATTLLDADGSPFGAGQIDPEGIALSPLGTLFVASEGALAGPNPVNPAIIEFGLGGQQIRQMTLPDTFLPDGSGVFGARNNLNFESLTLSPSDLRLTTAVENALLQDGPEADVDIASLSRVLTFDVATGQAVMETVYPTGPAAAAVSPAIPHGLVEMVALDINGTFLTLERGPSESTGLTVRLYLSYTQGALDVGAVDSLVGQATVPYAIDPPVVKQLLLDFGDLGLPFVNNFEGMTLGPVLPDGRQTLVLVSDNNFSFVPTEFVALALTFESVPAALPSLETPITHDDAGAPDGLVAGESGDPAIWLHPADPARSIVAVTLKDGGLMTLDPAGTVLQRFAPAIVGETRFNSVDVIYNVPLGDQKVDVFVVSDRQNDTLAVLAIDPQTRLLTDITSSTMPATLFGIDDGEATAYGLTAYTSPRSGISYAFVTQGGGNLVAQVALSDDGGGRVTGEVVRTLALPVPAGDAADSQAEGIVVDRFLARLYVALGNGAGIVMFNAEPDGGDGTLIHATDEPLTLDIGGLTIYYGAGDAGYLLASSPGDHTYAVFERRGDNAYLGSFISADDGDIDQANASEGVEVTNVALGPDFPQGMLIVQDGANDPQNTVPAGGALVNNSTNFKFLRWDSVANAFPEALLIDPGSYNPRYPIRSLLPMVLGD
jgi:myo-inositol-hexaphosphate 3-phosphohydrolase